MINIYLFIIILIVVSLTGDQLAANGVDLKYKSADEIDPEELEMQLETFHRESLKVSRVYSVEFLSSP